ncbi:MAG: hypothetical protein JNM01_01945 [Delftia acidovorans]|nr:hypothetical protein [Delftia acidovorans]
MKSLVAFVLVAGSACLVRAEPVLDWNVLGFDAQGNPTKSSRHSSHSSAQRKLNLLCGAEAANGSPLPETVSVRIEVRPFSSGGPQGKRIFRSAEITCNEVRRERDALSKYIPVPRARKAETLHVPSVWD